MTDVDPQQVGDWWCDSGAWREYASVQSCDGFKVPWSDDAGQYQYVWMEAYVDQDLTSHYLLDVRTKADGDAWEHRQFVGVSILPDGVVRTGLHGVVVGFRDPIRTHRKRFLDGMRWFSNFIEESLDVAFGPINEEMT